MTSIQNWKDKYGLIHLQPNPSPNETENPAMFTSVVIVLLSLTGRLNEEHCYNFIASLSWLIKDGKWYTTPLFKQPHFARDCFTGVIAALRVVERYAKENNDSFLMQLVKEKRSELPLFHDQMDHPRDVVLLLFAKFPWVFFVLMPLYFLLGPIATCWQTHKKRNGKVIAKTEGKILAFCILKAYKFDLLFSLCDRILKRTERELPSPRNFQVIVYTDVETGEKVWYWNHWSQLFKDYFTNHDHPAVTLIIEWEMIS